MNEVVTRRRVLLGLGAGILALPLEPYAQSSTKVWRIGFLSQDSADSTVSKSVKKDFPIALGKLGYREGRNLQIEWRWSEGNTDNLAALASDLVRLKVDLIVARTSVPVIAAKKATSTIPIVMLNGNIPVEIGIVKSLAHPGGNVTGTAYTSAETLGKQLQILKEIVPGVGRVAVMLTPGGGATYDSIFRSSIDSAASKLQMTVYYYDVNEPHDIDAVLAKIAQDRMDALFYTGTPLLRTRTQEIISFLKHHKVASIGQESDFATEGGLASYVPERQEYIDRTAEYVDKILKGTKPADLPIHQPTKYQFVINLKTAKTLGLKIPQSILLRTDRVIE